MEPSARCGHQLMGLSDQHWTHQALPGKIQEILAQRVPWAPLRALEHDVVLSPGRAEPLEPEW